MKEISRKVSKIQDRKRCPDPPHTSREGDEERKRDLWIAWMLIAFFSFSASLSDYQIRDLNDEINKLMREKHMWEVQLRNLGGPNYMRFGPRMYDEDGREVPGSKGYKYFGRARELPGVKELFEELKPKTDEQKEKELKLKREARKTVDADYYGFNRDEENGVLLEYERRKEEEAREVMSAKAKAEGDGSDGWVGVPEWRVPTPDEVMEFLVERRKSRLLTKLG